MGPIAVVMAVLAMLVNDVS